MRRSILRRLVDSGVVADLSAVDTRRIRATNIVAMVAAFILGSWVPIAVGTAEYVNAAENTVACLVFCSVLGINRARRPELAAGFLMYTLDRLVEIDSASEADPNLKLK